MMHSILHLVPDVPAVLHKGYEMLKPGGVLVSSTGCVAEANVLIRILISLARVFGLAPYVNYFTQPELQQMFTDAGFELEHVWRPRKNAAAFIIGRKTAQ